MPINHELLLRSRLLALRLTLKVLLINVDREQRQPTLSELNGLRWSIERVRKSLQTLKRQTCAKDTNKEKA